MIKVFTNQRSFIITEEELSNLNIQGRGGCGVSLLKIIRSHYTNSKEFVLRTEVLKGIDLNE